MSALFSLFSSVLAAFPTAICLLPVLSRSAPPGQQGSGVERWPAGGRNKSPAVRGGGCGGGVTDGGDWRWLEMAKGGWWRLVVDGGDW